MFPLENHKREQFFFSAPTIHGLASFLSDYESPCCLCAPMVGKALVEMNRPATLLDVDERFASTPGYRHYDLYRENWLDQTFDIILCDPPFFGVSLSQLFKAIRSLSHFNFNQRLVVAFLERRADALMGSFVLFGLRATGIYPEYLTAQTDGSRRIELFTNISDEELAQLRARMSP